MGVTKHLIFACTLAIAFACLTYICTAQDSSSKGALHASENTNKSERKSNPSQSTKPKNFEYYKIIIARNIFRRSFFQPEPPKHEPTPEEIKERERQEAMRKDDRVLRGIFYIEGKDLALVEGGGSSEFLPVGASIRGGGKIEKIEPMQVIIRYGEEVLKIRIGQTLAGGTPSPSPSYPPSAPTSTSDLNAVSSTLTSSPQSSTTTSGAVVPASSVASPSLPMRAPHAAVGTIPSPASNGVSNSTPTSKPSVMSKREEILRKLREKRKQSLQEGK